MSGRDRAEIQAAKQDGIAFAAFRKRKPAANGDNGAWPVRGLADANVVVDMIVQNVGRHGIANLTFTVPQADTKRAVKALEPVLDDIGGGQVAVHEHIAKLSVVGVGMKTHSGVAATLFQALADAGINIDLISTSEIKISVVVDLDRADEAVRAAHAAFGLDKV